MKTEIQNITEWIDAIADLSNKCDQRGGGQYGFIRQYGRKWNHAPLPSGVTKGTPKECYHDAFTAVIDSGGEFTYVEGIASSIIPIEHAWAIDREGNVIDRTWAALDYDPSEIETAYFGIPFSWEYVVKRAYETNFVGMLIDDWRGGWPLLQDDMRNSPELWLADHPLHPLSKFTETQEASHV